VSYNLEIDVVTMKLLMILSKTITSLPAFLICSSSLVKYHTGYLTQQSCLTLLWWLQC